MYGWKCNLTLFTSFQALDGINVNSIEWMDVNAPLMFHDEFFSHVGDSMTMATWEEVTNAVEAAIGAVSYASLYGTPFYSTTKTIWDIMTYRMPAYVNAFPNSWNFVLEAPSGTRLFIVIYIPGLKRLIEIQSTSSASTPFRWYICSVGEDGVAHVINGNGDQHSTLFNIPDMSTSRGVYSTFLFIGYKGDYTRESLANKENWATLHIGYRDYDHTANYSFQYGGVFLDQENEIQTLVDIFSDYSPPDVFDPTNPYEPGGDSGEGGGDGNFDDSSDQINDSTLPTISSANTGFTRIYNPTLAQVQALAQYLWTDESVIQTIWNHIKQYFENPMEAMIGFNLVPVTVPDGGTTTFKLMYIDTGVSMTAAASQFVDTDCGTLKLDPYYGSALDYSPYTKVSIFLPYIGMVSVDTDEVMGRTLQIKYRTDICSGACVAKILVDGNVLYQYTGHCAINIPFSAADFSSYVSAVMSTAKLAGTLALGASGALGPVAVSEITQQTGEAITKTVNTERNPETGRQITLSSQTQTRTPSEITTTKASYAGISPANVTNTVGEVISSKPHVEHSGSFSGTSGYLGVRRPYVIIKRPNMCMPANYQSLNGFPCMITLKLGDCKGFTRVQQVVLSNMGKATNPEQAEILGLLKNGVIL